MNIDWSKAPEGFPIWLEDVRPSRLSADDRDRSSWARDAQGEYTLYCVDGSMGWWTKSREGVDFVAHRQPEPWDGEGLPPVGTVCEIAINKAVGRWQECTVVGHDSDLAVYRYHNGEYHKYGAFKPGGPNFRPIRIPEQILADENEQAAIELFLTIQPCGKWHKLDGGMKASYRAAITLGWAKKVQP